MEDELAKALEALEQAKLEVEKVKENVQVAVKNLDEVKAEASVATEKKQELGREVDAAYADLTSGLQNLSVEDLDAPKSIELDFTIENLVNISCYQCYLQFPDEFSLSKLDKRLIVRKNTATLQFKHDQQNYIWTHEFEIDLDPRKSSMEIKVSSE